MSTVQNENRLYGHILPKIMEKVKLWIILHIDPIVPYFNPIRLNYLGGSIILDGLRLTCMNMIG